MAHEYWNSVVVFRLEGLLQHKKVVGETVQQQQQQQQQQHPHHHNHHRQKQKLCRQRQRRTSRCCNNRKPPAHATHQQPCSTRTHSRIQINHFSIARRNTKRS